MTHNDKLLSNARTLRKNMTPQERKLWYLFLKNYPFKIKKQKIIGNYIVDFYCAAARLIIELDGSQHYTEQGLDKDKKRSGYIKEKGYEVLRFTNLEIDRDFRKVCEQIDYVIQERAKEKRYYIEET